jgi:DNA repair protein RadC
MLTFRTQHIDVRLVRDGKATYNEQRIGSSEDAFDFLKELASEAVERFTVIFMSSRHTVIAVEILFSGSISESVMSVRHNCHHK